MATEILKDESSYLDAFRAVHGLTTGSAAWLVRLRQNAMDYFAEVGFPSIRDEEWKYTNVAPLAKIAFELPALEQTAFDLAEFTYPETAKSQMVFVNGVLRKDLSELSALPEGLVAVDLSAAVADERYGDIVWQHLAQEADYVANGFVALNTAFLTAGAFIYVPKNLIVETPLHLVFISDPGDKKAVSFPRVLVVAEENSSVTLIESYAATTNEQPYFTNAVVELSLKDNSRVKHYKVQRESKDAFHVATTAADLGRNSNYDTTTITLGAQLSRHDIAAIMDNEGAECRVDGLYIVTTGQHTDTHSVIDHRKPNCSSHQLYKGILDGKSRAVFNGKIFVRHDAQKTDAMQTNKNLLLSRDARIDTKPQLEILADDVKCAHGAAVGQIDEDELFYLETRGIHPDLARNLLTYGFAEEVITNISVASIRQQLDEAVLNRLNARLEV